MTKETFKEWLEIEFERCNNISEFKDAVCKLIDVYDKDIRDGLKALFNNYMNGDNEIDLGDVYNNQVEL